MFFRGSLVRDDFVFRVCLPFHFAVSFPIVFMKTQTLEPVVAILGLDGMTQLDARRKNFQTFRVFHDDKLTPSQPSPHRPH